MNPEAKRIYGYKPSCRSVIAEIASEMAEQDNAHTTPPIFAIQELKELPTPYGDGDGDRYIVFVEGEYIECTEDGVPLDEEYADVDTDDCNIVAYKHEWLFTGHFFFTRKAAENFISGCEDRLRVYVLAATDEVNKVQHFLLEQA